LAMRPLPIMATPNSGTNEAVFWMFIGGSMSWAGHHPAVHIPLCCPK
jgi:hypothetical protein